MNPHLGSAHLRARDHNTTFASSRSTAYLRVPADAGGTPKAEHHYDSEISSRLDPAFQFHAASESKIFASSPFASQRPDRTSRDYAKRPVSLAECTSADSSVRTGFWPHGIETHHRHDDFFRVAGPVVGWGRPPAHPAPDPRRISLIVSERGRGPVPDFRRIGPDTVIPTSARRHLGVPPCGS